MTMRRRLIAAALVLVFTAACFGLALAQSAQSTQGAPQGKRIAPTSGKGAKVATAVAENPTVQLGEVMEGQDYQHTFIIKNTGTAELQILSVRPG
jgi:archaellum component FlaG (FlaF/FlaG flagellin family)